MFKYNIIAALFWLFLSGGAELIFHITWDDPFITSKNTIDRLLNNCEVLVEKGRIDKNYLSKFRLNDIFYRGQYQKMGQVAIIFGAYAGIMIDVIYLRGTPQKINYT